MKYLLFLIRHNILIALSEDILPEPDAVMLTGITPQHTLAEGTTEEDFLKTFESEISIPGTIFLGYNTVRFDNEFMRFIHYPASKRDHFVPPPLPPTKLYK